MRGASSTFMYATRDATRLEVVSGVRKSGISSFFTASISSDIGSIFLAIIAAGGFLEKISSRTS